MPDHWAWVEEELAPILTFKPAGGFSQFRTQFPPAEEHPAVTYFSYDPDIPDAPINFAGPFGDFNVFCGWNGDMSLSGAILDHDTTASGELSPQQIGQTPRLVAVDTSDPDITQWAANIDFWYDMTGVTSVRDARFLPGTDIIVFTGIEGAYRKLIAVDTVTMTRVLDVTKADLTGVVGNILLYNFSYDETRIVITFDGTEGTWMFSRSGINPGGIVTGSNIFDPLFPESVRFTDDSNYLFIWGIPSKGHAQYLSTPPYTLIDAMPGNEGIGLFGPEPATVYSVTYHPTNTFFQRSSQISLGLGGINGYTQFFDSDWVLALDAGATSAGAFVGEWSGEGNIWIGTDGGRDPNGGFLRIYKTGTWESGSATPQEWQDIRLRPYH